MQDESPRFSLNHSKEITESVFDSSKIQNVGEQKLSGSIVNSKIENIASQNDRSPQLTVGMKGNVSVSKTGLSDKYPSSHSSTTQDPWNRTQTDKKSSGVQGTGVSTVLLTGRLGDDESPRFSLSVPNNKAVAERTPRVSVENAREDVGRKKMNSDIPNSVQNIDNSTAGNTSSKTSPALDVYDRIELKQPVRSAPQLVHKSPHELVIKWDPWTSVSQKGKQTVQIEYEVDWKEGRGPGGSWNSFASTTRACEARKRNLAPATWYSFRVRARQVS